jgi:hypothetical protein
MALILALAAVGASLTSASLVALGSTSMGLRYALAVVGGYPFFLLFARVQGFVAFVARARPRARSPRPAHAQTLHADARASRRILGAAASQLACRSCRARSRSW